MDLGIAGVSPDPEPEEGSRMADGDDRNDLVDDKLCLARMNSLKASIADLKEKVDWANRFIILTLVGVVGNLLVMLKEYVQ